MLKIGSVIAWLLIVFGMIRSAMGFFVAFSFSDEAYAAAAMRYLGTLNSGEAIDRGIIVFVAGVVIGLLVKIAKNCTLTDK